MPDAQLVNHRPSVRCPSFVESSGVRPALQVLWSVRRHRRRTIGAMSATPIEWLMVPWCPMPSTSMTSWLAQIGTSTRPLGVGPDAYIRGPKADYGALRALCRGPFGNEEAKGRSVGDKSKGSHVLEDDFEFDIKAASRRRLGVAELMALRTAQGGRLRVHEACSSRPCRASPAGNRRRSTRRGES